MFSGVRKIIIFLNRFKTKAAKQKWKIIYETGVIASKLTGICAFIGEENQWHSAVGGIFTVTCYILIFYTIQDNLRRNEFIKTIANCCCLGIIVVVSINKIKLEDFNRGDRRTFSFL